MALTSDLDLRNCNMPREVCWLLRLRYQMRATPTTTPATTPPTIAPMFGLYPEETLVSVGLGLCGVEDTDDL